MRLIGVFNCVATKISSRIGRSTPRARKQKSSQALETYERRCKQQNLKEEESNEPLPGQQVLKKSRGLQENICTEMYEFQSTILHNWVPDVSSSIFRRTEFASNKDISAKWSFYTYNYTYFIHKQYTILNIKFIVKTIYILKLLYNIINMREKEKISRL